MSFGSVQQLGNNIVCPIFFCFPKRNELYNMNNAFIKIKMWILARHSYLIKENVKRDHNKGFNKKEISTPLLCYVRIIFTQSIDFMSNKV